jgi:hypothetical protein
MSYGTLPVYGTKGVEAGGNNPGPRGHAMTWASNGYLWLFGGFGASSINMGHLNDVWRLNMGNTTAIENQVIKNDVFNVYPNPSTGLFYVSSNKQIENGNIRVYNALGQLISTQSINGVNVTIDLQNFQNGIYILQLEEMNTSSTIKVVKY